MCEKKHYFDTLLKNLHGCLFHLFVSVQFGVNVFRIVGGSWCNCNQDTLVAGNVVLGDAFANLTRRVWPCCPVANFS